MNAAPTARLPEIEDSPAPSVQEALHHALVGAGTQSWLVSMVFHLALLVFLALVMGTIKVVQVFSEPQFKPALAIEEPLPELKPLEITAVPEEPTVLDTESLTDPPPATDLIPSAGIGDFNIDPGGDHLLPGVGNVANFSKLAFGPGPASEGPMRIPGSGIGNGPPGAGSFRLRGDKRMPGGTKASERSVTAALRWIARHQNPDGSWSINHTPRCRGGFCSGPGTAETDSGGTALALLPFLAAGQTHESEGPYRQQIRAGINYLLKNQKADGDLSGSQFQMYSHGLATIALCEAYGMTDDSRVRTAAQAALRFIESGQNAQGSWRYTHRSTDSDTSVFAWQVMALKSGQMAGLEVNPAALAGSRQYLKLVASGSYGSEFSYTPGSRSTQTMTSAGLLASQYLGAQRGDPVVIGGIEYLGQRLPRIEDRNTYYWYYATQVMHNVPGREWDAWNRQMRRVLIDSQERNGCAAGSWNPSQPTDDPWGNVGGRLMVTSLSTLTLEVYYRYLPLYQLDKEKLEQEP